MIEPFDLRQREVFDEPVLSKRRFSEPVRKDLGDVRHPFEEWIVRANQDTIPGQHGREEDAGCCNIPVT